jgi:hypothetical protein
LPDYAKYITGHGWREGERGNFDNDRRYRKRHPRASGQNFTKSMNSISTRLSSIPTKALISL